MHAVEEKWFEENTAPVLAAIDSSKESEKTQALQKLIGFIKKQKEFISGRVKHPCSCPHPRYWGEWDWHPGHECKRREYMQANINKFQKEASECKIALKEFELDELVTIYPFCYGLNE